MHWEHVGVGAGCACVCVCVCVFVCVCAHVRARVCAGCVWEGGFNQERARTQGDPHLRCAAGARHSACARSGSAETAAPRSPGVDMQAMKTSACACLSAAPAASSAADPAPACWRYSELPRSTKTKEPRLPCSTSPTAARGSSHLVLAGAAPFLHSTIFSLTQPSCSPGSCELAESGPVVLWQRGCSCWHRG